MTDPSDKAREDFFSEAQEIIETLSRNLLALDEVHRLNGTDPSLINEAFRAVHTLKGLSSLFGATMIGALSHHLEDVLDDLRLGRIPLDDHILDVLFKAVEGFGRALAMERDSTQESIPSFIEGLVAQIRKVAAAPGPAVDNSSEYDIDPGLLAVLTEYEEHRLRTNIQDGLKLFKLRVRFDLVTIDKGLEEIKERVKKIGKSSPTCRRAKHPVSIQSNSTCWSRRRVTSIRSSQNSQPRILPLRKSPVGKSGARRVGRMRARGVQVSRRMCPSPVQLLPPNQPLADLPIQRHRCVPSVKRCE